MFHSGTEHELFRLNVTSCGTGVQTMIAHISHMFILMNQLIITSVKPFPGILPSWLGLTSTTALEMSFSAMGHVKVMHTDLHGVIHSDINLLCALILNSKGRIYSVR